MFALAVDLSKPSSEPKVMKASSLYRIKEGNKCISFKPKDTKFNKHEEFGFVDGDTIRRHVILALNESVLELKEHLRRTGRKHVPARLSITPVAEPKENYSFPEAGMAEKRMEKQSKQSEVKGVKAARGNEGSQILKQYHEQLLDTDQDRSKKHKNGKRSRDIEEAKEDTQRPARKGVPEAQEKAEVEARKAEEREKAKIEARKAKEREKAEIEAREAEEREKAKIEARKAKEREKAEIEAREAEEREKAKIEARKAKEREKAESEAREAKEQERAKVEAREAEEREKAEIEAREAEEREKAEIEAREAEEREKAEIEAREDEEREKAEIEAEGEGNTDEEEEELGAQNNSKEEDDSGTEFDREKIEKKKKKKKKKKKGSRRAKDSCNIEEHAELQQKLEELQKTIDVQEAEIKDLKSKQDIVQQLKTMMMSNSASGGSLAARTKSSKLGDLPSNIVDDDKEKVAETEVKVGPSRKIQRNFLGEIEKSTGFFTGRVESLVDLFYGKDAHMYSVKKKSKYAVEDEEIASMQKILLAMKWNKSIEITEIKIRSRVIKYLSLLRTDHAEKINKQDATNECESTTKSTSPRSVSTDKKRKRSPSSTKQSKKPKVTSLSRKKKEQSSSDDDSSSGSSSGSSGSSSGSDDDSSSSSSAD